MRRLSRLTSALLLSASLAVWRSSYARRRPAFLIGLYSCQKRIFALSNSRISADPTNRHSRYGIRSCARWVSRFLRSQGGPKQTNGLGE
jgi:hypothetical protein